MPELSKMNPRLAGDQQRVGGVVSAGVFEGAVLRHLQQARDVLDVRLAVDRQLGVQAVEAVGLGGDWAML